jgi:hypothetical protein
VNLDSETLAKLLSRTMVAVGSDAGDATSELEAIAPALAEEVVRLRAEIARRAVARQIDTRLIDEIIEERDSATTDRDEARAELAECKRRLAATEADHIADLHKAREAIGEAIRERDDERKDAAELRIMLSEELTKSVDDALDYAKEVMGLRAQIADGHRQRFIAAQLERDQLRMQVADHTGDNYTKDQAAHILSVSRSFLAGLTCAGAFPVNGDGTIPKADFLAYVAKNKERQRLALAELSQEAQDLGLAYNGEKP